MKLLTTAGILLGLLLSSSSAMAYQVFPGCTLAPTTTAMTPQHTPATFYVDPVNGKSPAAGGTGSITAPWNSLQGVLSGTWASGATFAGYTRPLLSSVPYTHSGGSVVADQVGSPPVQPGDTIILANGNYGDVVVGSINNGVPATTVNSNWVKVIAASGATPVMTTLAVERTNMWIFDGIKVESQNNTGDNNGWNLVSVSDLGINFPTKDIVFNNMNIASEDSSNGLTAAQLASQYRSGFGIAGTTDTGTVNLGQNGFPYTSCIAIENSHVKNVQNGAVLQANQLLFTGNEIDHFTYTGIAPYADNLIITKNKIHDAQNDGGNGGGFLGQYAILPVTIREGIPAGETYNQFSHIVIDGNYITRQTDVNLAVPQIWLNGIGIFFFDDWSDITITNNVVITQNACDGIHLSAAHNSLVAYNTVAEEQNGVNNACPSVIIQVGGGNQNSPASTNTRIFANLAPTIQTIDGTVTMDNNIGTCNYDLYAFCIPIQVNGARENSGNSLNDAADGSSQVQSANWVNFWPLSTLGVAAIIDPVFWYDLHIASTSFILQSFVSPPAGVGPPLDIEGKPRFGDGKTICTQPIPGAYAYTVPCSGAQGS